MNHWQSTSLVRKQLPRELSGFEIEAFFTFTASERALIEARRGPSLKLGLALQIGFLRMSGRVLDAVRIVPLARWKHLCNQIRRAGPGFGVGAGDVPAAPNLVRSSGTSMRGVALSSPD